ncbi:MAG: hypothetical protein ABIZ80_09935 [Bryobacteraceae bacterium]
MTRPLLALTLVIPVAGLIHLAAQQAPQEASREVFRQIDADTKELTEITGLPFKKKVPYDLITREKVNQFLQERLKESVKPEQIHAEELTLKKFGFVPQDFDLKKSTVDLLTEQAAAFYDFYRKKLFLTNWASSAMQDSALIHELAHALADQHFRLGKFIQNAGKSDDSALARMAVMEGQATWLMTEAMARKNGQSLGATPALLDMMSGGTEAGASQFPVFNQVPLYLRETLMFPYTAGARFQHAVFMKMKTAAFAELFRHPPETTQQILHPEKYFARDKPSTPVLPEMKSARGYKRIAEGMMGELDHSILIRQFGTVEQAKEISPHWRGGTYAILEDKNRRNSILAYAVEWDDAAIARKYFEFYKSVLGKKWKHIEVLEDGERQVSGRGDDGRFTLSLDGNRVSSLEGMPEPPALR